MKGDMEYIPLIFTVVFAMLMIVIVAPFVSNIEFDAELNAIKESSANQYKANAIAASLVQNDSLMNRSNHYIEWEEELEQKKSERADIENQIEEWKSDEDISSTRVDILVDIAKDFVDQDVEPDAEYEGDCDDDSLELRCERNTILDESDELDMNDFERYFYRKHVLDRRIEELESNIANLESDLKGVLSKNTDSYRYGLYIREDGDLNKQWEISDGDGGRRFTSFRASYPSEKHYVYFLGVAR